MVERNVGSVKQVIRCLLMEREMGKESWPSVLSEVSFVLNNVRNSTTKISPHMITYGRQPRVPTDLWAEHRDASSDSLGEYFKSLQERQESLTDIVTTNEARSFANTKERYDRGKRYTRVAPGDMVLRERGKQDSLATKFERPYRVTGQRGANIQLDRPGGRKWYHANRCKRLEKNESWLAQTRNLVTTDGKINEEPEPIEDNSGEEPDEKSGEDQDPTPPEADTESTYSHYGRRHKPKKYSDFIPWSQIPENQMAQEDDPSSSS